MAYPIANASLARTGVCLALAAILMMFAGLISAYVVSQGLSSSGSRIGMVPMLWANTGILLASSIAMEAARRSFRAHWVTLTVLLGMLFLAGQITVFRQLSSGGVYLNSGPHGSFFYVLTGLHGVHVLGGILALACLNVRLLRRSAAGAIALYWHFMGALWICLLLLLFS